MNKKIKMFLMGFLICAFCFIGIDGVSAKEVSWNDIMIRYNEMSNTYNDYNIDTYDNTSVTPATGKMVVSLTNPKYGNYSITFDYAENKISYTNNRDVSSADDETKIYYAQTDDYFILAMIYTILDLYQIDENIDLSSNLETFGITTEADNELSYVENGTTITIQPIKSFELDLTTFNNATVSYQDKLQEQNTYTDLVLMFKSLLNPMAESIVDFELNDFSDLFDNPTTNEETTNTTNKTKENKVDNPKTGLSLPVAGGVVVIIFAGAAYLVLNKKNKFRHI